MDADLPRFTRSHIYLTILLGFVTGFFFLLSNALPAQASDNTSCGQAVCYVDSTVRSESDWASEPYVQADGTISSGGGSGGQPKFMTEYVSCSAWHNRGSGSVVFAYPGENSPSFDCWMNDRAMNEACPPSNGRASNGRVDYYIQRENQNGDLRWFFARFKCLYPTDTYFYPSRSEGKVYTGGQTDFYQTTSPTKQPKRTAQETAPIALVTSPEL